MITPGADVPPPREDHEGVELVMIAEEERAALRAFLRALRGLPRELDWHATVFARRHLTPPATLGRELRDRIRFIDPSEAGEDEVLAQADVVVLASEGVRPTPGVLLRAVAAGAVPVASRLPAYEELSLGGRPRAGVRARRDVQTLTAHLARLIGDPELLEDYRRQADGLRATLTGRGCLGARVALQRLAARRHRRVANGRLRARLAGRALIDVDLHMHTDHSYDCATPVEVLLAEARARGWARSRSPITTRSPARTRRGPRPRGSR